MILTSEARLEKMIQFLPGSLLGCLLLESDHAVRNTRLHGEALYKYLVNSPSYDPSRELASAARQLIDMF